MGTAGNGGSSSFVCEGVRPGDGSRNVRSVIEPELLRRSKPFRPAGSLVLDPMEPRRCVRFVCTSATFVGVVVWERSAAAAAADDSFVLAFWLARKAWTAAVLAVEDAGVGGDREP